MSTLRVNTIQNSGGTGSPEINGLARAWVNFNGQGTVAIRAASNVSSITDNGTGDYTVNFTTAFPDANYAFSGIAGSPGASISTFGNRSVPQTASSLRVAAYVVGSGSPTDESFVEVIVVR